MRTIILSSLLGMFIWSCGPNKSEISQREKFVADSVARVDSIRREQLRVHLEKIEVGKGIKENYLKELLALNEKELQAAEAKLKKIKEFQLGRSVALKEQQLSEQRRVISDLRILSKNIEREIAQVKLHQYFEFQKTPKGTLDAFIQAANDGDTENMRYLLDPYGEFSNDVARICFIEIYPRETIADWRRTFGKSRMMSDPKMENNLAHIEIAYGEQSNKLEEMTMVEREGYWYFLDF